MYSDISLNMKALTVLNKVDYNIFVFKIYIFSRNCSKKILLKISTKQVNSKANKTFYDWNHLIFFDARNFQY